MVYKYWDSITKEDLEFSVASKANVWLLQEDKDYDQFEKGLGTTAGYNSTATFARSESGMYAWMQWGNLHGDFVLGCA